MTHPERVVVDTNVLIVANGKAPHASDNCVIRAVEFLEHARTNSVVVMDGLGLISDEYRKYCSYRGQPGVGDFFFLHLHRMQGTSRVQLVDVTPDGDGSYREVPSALRSFDPSDQKFIAVVVADDYRSEIVNCVDSDWSEAKDALQGAKIQVHQVCEG